jgi:hypothetical protein
VLSVVVFCFPCFRFDFVCVVVVPAFPAESVFVVVEVDSVLLFFPWCFVFVVVDWDWVD